ncbi:uncharacterized protein LOC128883575 [Hylaeus volcanicus]|uniref:uncharacterized protein LOC128883575 n=1 Tax=Hylaeus volcanicus TaxID=313075 RepID=UPI0023B80557|nr:uncharacterized protein LOC128883575 [Hylaeus volcanicus]
MKKPKTDENVSTKFYINIKHLNNVFTSDNTIQWCSCFHFSYLCLLQKTSITFLRLFPQKQGKVEENQRTIPICVESLKNKSQDKVSIQINRGCILHVNPSQQGLENPIPQVFLSVTCDDESENQQKIVCFHVISSTGLHHNEIEEDVDSIFVASSNIYQFVPRKSFSIQPGHLLLRIVSLNSTDTLKKNDLHSLLVLTELNNSETCQKFFHLQVVSTITMDSLISVQNICVPKPFCEKSTLFQIKCITIINSCSYLFLIYPTSYIESSAQIGVAVYHSSEMKLLFLGWFTFSSQYENSGLVSIDSCSTLHDQLTCFSTVKLSSIWSKNVHMTHVLNWNQQSNLISIYPFKQSDSLATKSSDKLVFCIPISSFLVLHCFWNKLQSILKIGFLHSTQQTYFFPSSQKIIPNQLFSIQLNHCPKNVLLEDSKENTTNLILILKHQVFLYPLPSLHSLSTYKFIELMNQNHQIVPELPSDNILKSLNFENIDILKDVYNYLTGIHSLSTESLKNLQPHLEKIISQLIDSALIHFNLNAVNKILDLKIPRLCRKLFESSILSEKLIVQILQQDPHTYLPYVVKYLCVSHSIFVQELQQELTVPQLEIILHYLTAWCYIGTELPEALTAHEEFPPLQKVFNFLCILVDAKFNELATIFNTTMMNHLQTIASSVSACLIAKKNVQKFLGQLHSLHTAKKSLSHLSKNEETYQLIEQIQINI